MLEIVQKNKIEPTDEDEWINLWSVSKLSHFFNSPNWYRACLEGLSQDICVWFVYDDRSLVAVIPLCNKIRFGIPCLVTIGNPYTDKCPILIDHDFYSELPNMLSLIGKHKPILLHEVPEGWGKIQGNDQLKDFSSINPFIRLHEDILSQVKKGEWNNVKRKAEKNLYHFKVFYGKEVSSNINLLWEIESSSNKPKRRRDMFDTDNVKAMFSIVSMSEYSLLAVLYDDELPIAHMFGYLVNNTFLAHHMAFREEYFKETPGKIVIVNLVTHLIEYGCEIFDFSRGETLLKKHFSKYSEINYNYYCNLRYGKKLCVILAIKAKKLYKRMRHNCKRIIMSLKGFDNDKRK